MLQNFGKHFKDINMETLSTLELSQINGGSELSDALCYLWGWITESAKQSVMYCSQGNMAAIVAYK